MVITPEIKALFWLVIGSLALAIPFIAGTIILIFLLNKYIVDKNGRTNNSMCSIIGTIIFPIIFTLIFGYKFGFTWLVITFSVITGVIIGYFSYTLDEMMETYWEEREITIPGTLGFMSSIFVISLLFSHVWIEGDMRVTNKASARRVIIERYTYHHSTDRDGKDTSFYSWDYLYHVERFEYGIVPPELIEDRDYKLGRGALAKKDRAHEVIYQLIGGHFFSEKKNQWKPFVWLLLARPQLQDVIQTGEVYRIKSNFYGNPIGCTLLSVESVEIAQETAKPALPGANYLPPADSFSTIISYGWEFIIFLATEEEYRLILFIFIGIAVILTVAAVLIPSSRDSIKVFLIAATIVVPLMILIESLKSGRRI